MVGTKASFLRRTAHAGHRMGCCCCCCLATSPEFEKPESSALTSRTMERADVKRKSPRANDIMPAGCRRLRQICCRRVGRSVYHCDCQKNESVAVEGHRTVLKPFLEWMPTKVRHIHSVAICDCLHPYQRSTNKRVKALSQPLPYGTTVSDSQ